MLVSFKTSKFYFEDKLFSVDGDLEFYYELKKFLLKNNIRSHTHDLIIENPVAEICLDNIKPTKNKNLKILILLESKAVFPGLYDPKYLKSFDLVFTYDNLLIDNKKILKLNYSYYLKAESNSVKFKDKKFLCNISSNKYSNYKTELYSERIKVIEFYNKKHSENFDLYGFGWDSYIKNKFLYKLVKQISSKKILRAVFKLFSYFFGFIIFKELKIYKGIIKNKYEVLKTYKFSICFENYYNHDGYVTEKIFDCFKCNVVPIYYGFSEIHKLIPENTFIDYRKFNSLQDLNDYLTKMKPNEYSDYLKNINKYLSSSLCREFDVKVNAKRVSKIIYESLNKKI